MMDRNGVSLISRLGRQSAAASFANAPTAGFNHCLEQVEHCTNCNEPLAYYKAGLFLPFVVITIVIYITAVVMLGMELRGQGNPLVYLYAPVSLSVIIPLAILPSVKGAIWV